MFLMKDGQVKPAQARVSSERLYTLAELEALAREFADGNDASSDLGTADAIKHRLYLGMFIVYLRRRQEKEGGDDES